MTQSLGNVVQSTHGQTLNVELWFFTWWFFKLFFALFDLSSYPSFASCSINYSSPSTFNHTIKSLSKQFTLFSSITFIKKLFSSLINIHRNISKTFWTNMIQILQHLRTYFSIFQLKVIIFSNIVRLKWRLCGLFKVSMNEKWNGVEQNAISNQVLTFYLCNHLHKWLFELPIMLVDCGVLKKKWHTILKFDHKVLRTSLAFH
jgi:hypothetical protein